MTNDYYIVINDEAVPVSEDVYRAYHAMAEHERYLERKDKRRGKTLYSDLDTDELLGEEMIPSSKIANPVEQAVMDKFLKLQLYAGIAMLTADEQALIHTLYVEEKSQSQLSRETGIPQQTISYRAQQILKRLRKFIEEENLSKKKISKSFFAKSLVDAR